MYLISTNKKLFDQAKTIGLTSEAFDNLSLKENHLIIVFL